MSMELLRDLPLPANLDAERFVLAAALIDGSAAEAVGNLLTPEDFSSNRHRLICSAVLELHSRGTRPDAVTVAETLQSRKQLQAADGLSYIVSLEDGMPRLAASNLEAYIEIIRAKATLRSAIQQACRVIEGCLNEGGQSEEMIAQAERLVGTFADGGLSRACDSPRSLGKIIEDEGGIDAFLSPKIARGFRIPIQVLDSTLDGLRQAKLYLWAARPGLGKTALMEQCAESVAAQGGRPLIISKEMSGRDLMRRSICGRADVSAYHFRKGLLSQEQKHRLAVETNRMLEFEDRLLVYDNPECSVQKIRFLLRRLRSLGVPADSLFVDYVQLIDSVGNSRSRTEELGQISKGFVKIKKEFNIPVVVLSQINREGDTKGKRTMKEDDEPYETNIAESDQLVRDADSILLMWESRKEQEVQESNPQPHMIINWKIPKNRDGVKNRGGRNRDGNDEQGLCFVPKRARFIEDVDIYSELQEAA